MASLRAMATRGVTAATAVANKAAAEMKSSVERAASASASAASPVAGRYGAFTDDGVAQRQRNGHTIAASQQPPDQNSPARIAMRLAERLDAGAAAAEILFDMRAHSSANGGAATVTAEETETLHELRATCEDHLNTLARVVEGGGVHDDALLVRAIEVAESLVAAIGDDEEPNISSAEMGGYAPPARDCLPIQETVNYGYQDPSTETQNGHDRNAVVDLLGGLDVGGQVAPPTPVPPVSHVVKERPATQAEEEAMVAAAIAASLAESEQPRPEETQQTTQKSSNLIDF